jgi:KipI family sensor histidine kinase inhibitor
MPDSPTNIPYPRLQAVGESAVLVEYEPEISLEVNRRVRQLASGLEQDALPGMVEIVPAYRSLMVSFDPEQIELAAIVTAIQERAKHLTERPLPESRLFRIPTVYGGEHGPDLARIAETTGMTQEQVIELFSSQRYPVYCLGFLCALAYMGGVPKPLQFPRLATPRTRLPAGSVGMANAQAVVLPMDQPSGFHYLGRTFVTMYDPRRFPPTPIRAGDFVECPSVSEEEALKWKGRFLGECQSDCPANS